MNNLQFIGMGSAFNTAIGNTSCMIKNNDSLLLIDCGASVFHKLQEMRAFDKLKNLYIIITHTHLDHVGSLGEVIFYCHYILNIKPIVYFPDGEHLKKFLTLVGVLDEMYILDTKTKIDLEDENIGRLSFEFIAVPHVKIMPTFGFIMDLVGNNFYYSGDASDISEEIVEKLRSGNIKRIYQDTSGLDYEGNAHMFFGKLCERISPELRSKVYCMHLDGHVSTEEIRSKGFNVVSL